MSVSYQKTGYLNSDFRIFYLSSAEARDFQSHYHDFHKLLLFVSGSVSYYIEGETYQLQPYDIVLVRLELVRFAFDIVAAPAARAR